jgi:polyhydroxybutyrate depolymerase
MGCIVALLAACGSTKTRDDRASSDAGEPARGDAAPAPAADGGEEPLEDCTGRPARSGDSVMSLTVGAVERSARVHVPSAYDPTKPTPVVLNFHGSSSNALQQELFTQLNAKADAAGFIAVHPEGLGGSFNAGTCCEPATSDGVDDVAFVRALIDLLEVELCVHPKQVFATGMSNGAEMTHRLACELSDRVAAIAPVAGGDLTVTCAPSRPISVLAFHGTADTEVPFEGDAEHPPIPQTIADWVERNDCESATRETFQKGDSTCTTHDACAQGVEVTLCTIMDGGHTWPGGLDIPFLGKTTHDLSANDAMWEFFQRHPLP